MLNVSMDLIDVKSPFGRISDPIVRIPFSHELAANARSAKSVRRKILER
jgi:hypothetical protein